MSDNTLTDKYCKNINAVLLESAFNVTKIFRAEYCKTRNNVTKLVIMWQFFYYKTTFFNSFITIVQL